MKFSVKLNLN